ncbi:MAG: hypothetical protein ACR5K2_00255 [Wolbachia sp.]
MHLIKISTFYSQRYDPPLPDKTVPTDALLDIESLVEELLIGLPVKNSQKNQFSPLEASY